MISDAEGGVERLARAEFTIKVRSPHQGAAGKGAIFGIDGRPVERNAISVIERRIPRWTNDGCRGWLRDAYIQVDGYDATRLMNGVRFIDNGLNLQATSLAVPEPAAPATANP